MMKNLSNMEIISKSEKDTIKFSKKLAKSLKDGDIVLLSGDLGAGKTVFAKGFVKGAGVKKVDVVSPTFTILNQYGEGKVFHFDLYRMSSFAEFEAAGLTEVLYGSGLKLVEWPEKIGFDRFPADTIVVRIEKIDDKTRKIIVSKGE